MQIRNEATFAGIQGVHVIADDLIVAAKDNDEHDIILHKVMQRGREKNGRFNKNKVQFKRSKVSYHTWAILSANGIQPCPKKIDAILNMPVPCDKTSLQRLNRDDTLPGSVHSE